MSSADLPTAFITYAWTSEDHRTWVKNLADRLRNDGVNVILDRYHLREGDDTIKFMEQLQTDPTITKVVAICDRNYARKVNAREGGAGTEGSIMSQAVYEQVAGEKNKYVAVVVENFENGRPALPSMFQTKKYIDMTSEDSHQINYERLLRFLHDAPEDRAPEIGPKPHFLTAQKPPSVTSAKAQSLQAALRANRGIAGAIRDYHHALLHHLDQAPPTITDGRWNIANALQSLEDFESPLAEYTELLQLSLDFDALQMIDAFPTLMEDAVNRMEARARTLSISISGLGNVRLLLQHLLLCTTAVLIHNKRFQELATLLGTHWMITYHTRMVERLENYPVIQGQDSQFSDLINRHLNQNFYSPVGELFTRHHKLTFPTHRQLYDADLVLFLYSMKHFTDGLSSQRWWPYTGPYWGSAPSVSMLRSESRSFLAQFCTVFGFTSPEDFRDWLKPMVNENASLLNRSNFGRTDVREVLNTEKLASRH